VRTLLERMAANPSLRLGDVPMLTGAERRRMLVELNDTQVALQDERGVHELFADQVALAPQRTALVAGCRALTYGELERRSSRLACHLATLGVGPGGLVGLCGDRSLETVVGLLGILKAGGAWVALDTEAPEARLAAALAEAEVSVVLAERHLIERLPSMDATVVVLDAWSEGDVGAAVETAVAVRPSDLACVTYTTDPAGQPLGVALEHRQVVNLLMGLDALLQCGLGDVWLATAGLASGGAVLDYLWTLTRGRTVVLDPGPPRDALGGAGDEAGDGVAEALADYSRSTYLSDEHERLNGVGEAADGGPRGAARTADRPLLAPGCASFDSVAPHDFAQTVLRYGVTHMQCTPAQARALLECAESREALRTLKQLLLGGGGLTPELVCELRQATSAQLIHWYGTPETTVWALAHVLERTAREAALLGRPLANVEAYLLDRRGRPCPAGVVGELYIGGEGVARGYLGRPELTDQRFLPHPLRSGGQARLFRTGQLARFRFRDDGALDLERVEPSGGPELAGDGPEAAPFEAPGTPLEQAVAALWEGLIGVERVGLHDNFFELGGHSQLAMRALAETHRLTGRRLKPTDLAALTLGEVAAVCEHQQPSGPSGAQANAGAGIPLSERRDPMAVARGLGRLKSTVTRT
jgi:acyl-CoA synthetase (AMP-forming)/AMP-acid ligase II